ncbi:MAG: hypothetical protein JWM64_1607 [Frankiales bacterium]|nr:hypothetical protein [Frankiales bacterium]
MTAAELKRRVLLTAVLSLVLFLTATYLHTAAGVSDWWLLPVVVLLYVGVVRPLMAPVRAASRLRRDLAYHAFLEMRAEQRQEPTP